MREVIRCYLIRKDVNLSKCCAEVRRLICPASYRQYQRCCCMSMRHIPHVQLSWSRSLVPDVNDKQDRIQVPDSEKQKQDFPIPLSKGPKRFPERSRCLPSAAGSLWHLTWRWYARVFIVFVFSVYWEFDKECSAWTMMETEALPEGDVEEAEEDWVENVGALHACFLTSQMTMEEGNMSPYSISKRA